MNKERFYIGKIGISKVNLETTLQTIDEAFKSKKAEYICVTNSRTSYFSNNNEEYCRIQNNSLLTIPDGLPLVWIARNKGHKDVERVSGPDLLNAILEISVQKGYSHYFYGSTPEGINQIVDIIKSKNPGINIKGAVSPPFQPVEDFNTDELAAELNELKPNFFWCGLGAPKQEWLISKLYPKLDSTVCIGVGLAFDYMNGSVKRAPLFMQVSGLEWTYRLFQQPKNIKRAVRPISWMFKNLIISFFKK